MTDWKALAAPFPPTDLEWRLQQAGKRSNGEVWAKCLAYLTNRAIMDRFDEVVGPENWRNEEPRIVAVPNGPTAFICGLSVRIDDQWVTKWDGAEPSDIEAVKGGLSNSMKRAAVHWGCGRYLYDLPAGWAKIHDQGQHYGKTKDGTEFKWDAPDLPKWALPDAGSAQMDQSGDSEQAGGSAVKASTQQPPASTPLARPGPYAPTEKQVNFFTKLMGSHVFTEDERKRGMEWLAKSGTRETIKSQIDWAKAKVAERERGDAAE